MYLIFEFLMLLALTGLITVFDKDLANWIIILKTAASLCFVLTGICGYLQKKSNGQFSKTMLTAFFGSMAGDILLALDQNQGIFFILGVVSFAFAHILFSFAFCRLSPITKKDYAVTVVVFVCLLLLLFLGNFNFQGLLPVLIGYAAIISFMMVKSLSLFNCKKIKNSAAVLILSGGVLFLLSDIVLLFWLFGIGIPKEVQSVNWVLYYLAEGCLAASLSKMD